MPLLRGSVVSVALDPTYHISPKDPFYSKGGDHVSTGHITNYTTQKLLVHRALEQPAEGTA